MTTATEFTARLEFLAESANRTLERRRKDAEGYNFTQLADTGRLTNLVEAEAEARFYDRALKATSRHGEDSGRRQLARAVADGMFDRSDCSDTFTTGARDATAKAARRVMSAMRDYLDPAVFLTYA